MIRLFDPILLPFFDRHTFKGGPQWLHRLQHAYLCSFVSREIVGPTFAADAAGAGMTDAWWPPGTEPEEILRWADEEIAATPRVGPIDEFEVCLAHATAAEIAIATNTGPPLPQAHILIDWYGMRAGWWTEGRDLVAAAILPTHTGLYMTLNGMGTAFWTAMQARKRRF